MKISKSLNEEQNKYDIILSGGDTVFSNKLSFTITSIACYKGFFISGGAEEVGKATTSTVVVSCVAVVFLDYLLAALLLWLKLKT